MVNVYKNYDGPLYVVAAKSLYSPKAIEDIKLELSIPAKYFAAHLPFYPLLIRLFREIMMVFGGWFANLAYLKSMLLVNLLFSVFLSWVFYFILKRFKLTSKPLILTIIFLFIPRFLAVRSVGAPEAIFIMFILLSLYFFEKEKYLLAGIFGGLSVMVKTPGILLFASYCLVFVEKILKEKKINYQWLMIGLIPFCLIMVFLFYGLQYGDFFAYFNSGDNVHLVSPFSVFNFKKTWVGTGWLEEIIFYYFLYGLTILNLKNNKYRSFFYFSLVFFIAVIFIEHRDISRYSLPLLPLALINFEKFFTSKKFLLVFLILLPAIFLYVINFLNFNLMSISDFRPFL